MQTNKLLKIKLLLNTVNDIGLYLYLLFMLHSFDHLFLLGFSNEVTITKNELFRKLDISKPYWAADIRNVDHTGMVAIIP